MKKLFCLFFACVLGLLPADAQFSDQRNYVGSSGGSANAQTLAVANYTLNVGVVIRGLMSFSNTGAMTLNTTAVKKQTSSGLAALTGGEVIAGQVAQFIYDGTQYELFGGGGGSSSGQILVNAQTSTAYTFNGTGTGGTGATPDFGKLTTFSNIAAIAVTLPQAGSTGFGAGVWMEVQNLNTGLVTITPTTSTINGNTLLKLERNVGFTLVSDGTNWQINGTVVRAPPGSIDISANCSLAQLNGSVDATTCVQATIDYAYANSLATVTCPSGTHATISGTIYQDPPGDIRATGHPSSGQGLNMTFMAYGGSSDPNVGFNCQFNTSVNSTYAWIIGPGRGMVLRNVSIIGPTGTNLYRGEQNSGGIGVQVSDLASRTLLDNIVVQNFYTCEKFGGNYDNSLADSNTIFKGDVSNCFNGLYFTSGNADVNTAYDVEIQSATNSIRGGSPVNVVGGNYSSSNINHTFAVTSVSTLTAFTYIGLYSTYSFTANITAPDSFLTTGNVYDSFVFNTPHYGVVPCILVNYSAGVATFALYPEWLASQYATTNILTGTTIQTDLQAATQVYAAERLRIFNQGIFTITNLWVEEDPTGSVTLVEGQGGGEAVKISGLYYNNDPTSTGQTTNPNFYIMQAFPFIDMPGLLGGNGLATLDISDANIGLQPLPAQDRFIINGEGEYEGHYHFHDNGLSAFWGVNLTVANASTFDQSGAGANQVSAYGFGAWDQTQWFLTQGDAFNQFGGWNYSPFHGYIPDQSTTPCITPTQLTTLSGTLPTIVTGSPILYPRIFGGVTYRECEWTGVPTHMFVMSNHHFYSYGQNLTTSNVTGLSWSYTAGSDVVFMSANLMARMYNGLQIGLNNGSGNAIYMVKGVYPTLGYVTVYSANNTAASTGLTGTVGTVYTGTLVSQEAYSFTTTQ